MDDLEITKLCAEAVDIQCDLLAGRWRIFPYHNDTYDPLHDDAQAMALVKKCKLGILYCDDDEWQVVDMRIIGKMSHEVIAQDLNRAICECVARMQLAKAKP